MKGLRPAAAGSVCPVLNRGPIPAHVHGVLDYVLGAVLVLAPFVLSFEDDTATVACVVAGVAELVVGATTAWGPGLVKLIPPAVHGMIDYVFTAALIVAPFILGFDDDTTALVFFLVVGIGGLALVAATRFVEEPTAGP